jgi:Mu transposase, C-terminal domain
MQLVPARRRRAWGDEFRDRHHPDKFGTPAKVSSTAPVRYRMNDYSAPTAYGFRDVLVKGFVDEVAIICGASEIARHPRVYGVVVRPEALSGAA